MRVLQAMAGARHGGAEAFFVRLVSALAAAGTTELAVIRHAPERASALRAAGVEVEELRFGGPLDLVTRWRLKGILARFRPDVVLSWMSRASAALPYRPVGGEVRVGRLGGYYDLKYFERCDHLVGNTPDIAEWIRRQGWRADRVHYLPNFVDATPAVPVSRAGLDTPPDAPVILALGRLHPNKAFDVALHALAEIPGAHLWIAGAGPLDAELKALAQRLGLAPRVRFLGWRDDATALIAAADVVVCPSRVEPLGNVVIEAWAHRRPVVAARAVGPAALIADGVDGLLVPIDDAPALARALTRVLVDADVARSLAAGGAAAHAARFAETAVVGQWQAFFAEVVRCAA